MLATCQGWWEMQLTNVQKAAAASWLFGRCREGINSTTAGSETDFAIQNLLNTWDRTRVQLLPLATVLFGAITEIIPVFTSTVVPPWQTSGKCCVYDIADWSIENQICPGFSWEPHRLGWHKELESVSPNRAHWGQTGVQQHMDLAQVLAHIFFRSCCEGFINPASGWNRALPKALSSNGKIVYKGSHSKVV